jgi:hypothetical protein
MNTSETCDCEYPGWCERHKIYKSQHWVDLCKRRGKYWRAWEEGRGPGQIKPSGSHSADHVIDGPGSELKRILGCGCTCEFLGILNSWGVDGCLERFDEIVVWLRKGTKGFTEEAAARILKIAINRVKSRIQGAKNEMVVRSHDGT